MGCILEQSAFNAATNQNKLQLSEQGGYHENDSYSSLQIIPKKNKL